MSQDQNQINENRFQAVFEQAAVGVGIIESKTGRFRSINQRYCNIIGYSAEEMSERTFASITHPDDIEEDLSNMERLLGGEIREFTMEKRYFRKDGTIVWVNLTVSPMWKPGEEPHEHIAIVEEITSRKNGDEKLKEAHRALQESERRMRTLVENLPGMTYRCSGTSARLMNFVSRGSIYLVDSTPEELLFAGEFDYGALIHPDDLPKVSESICQAVRTGIPFEVEYRIQINNQQEKWVCERGRLVSDAESGGAVIEGFIYDISDRRVTELELREEKQFTDTALDSQLDTFFLFDISTGKALRWNAAFRRTSGYSDEEIAAMPAPSSYYGPADLERAGRFIQDVLENRTGTIELDLICKDRRTVPMEYRVAAVPDHQGVQKFLISIGRDVSERKKSEHVLRQHSQRMQQILDTTMDGYILADTQGQIIDVNPAYCETIGYSREELFSMDIQDLEVQLSEKEIERRIEQMVNWGRDRFETKHQTKDGGVVDLEVSVVVIQAENKPMVAAFVRDVTEQNQAKRERIHLREQLHHSQKMESIGRLAGGIAHDFNNLLTAIVGFSDLIHNKLDDNDPMKKDIAAIQAAGESAASLTHHLLAFSRKQIVSPKVVSINEIISRAETMLRRIIGEDIALEFRMNVGIGLIRIDPGQVEQILVNLMVNSRDAMPDGGTLTVETAACKLEHEPCQICPEPINGNYAMLSVVDTGRGIDSATTQQIFEPFFTTKEQGKGTGLGLSTVHGIIIQNNGHLQFSSAPGRGTIFKVYLPVVSERLEENTLSENPDQISGRETLLVVDDNEIVREVAVRTLRSLGYNVIEAHGSGEALFLFEKHSKEIDLLLTDVVMPHMSGKELSQRLDRTVPDLKTLYMSGYTDEIIAHHGILEKGIHFIQKPFRPHELAREVRKLLDG